MPRKALTIKLFHEWVWVKLLDIMHAWLVPESFEEHHGTYHGWHTSCVADALHACLLVCGLMRAVIIYIICVLLTAFEATDATAYARLTIVVLAKVLWVGQNCLEELQRNYLDNCLARKSSRNAPS